MIQSILENEATINNFLIDHQKDCLVLSPDELEGCSNLVAFLKLFLSMTDRLQGEKYPTISMVWPNVLMLSRKCGSNAHGVIPCDDVQPEEDPSPVFDDEELLLEYDSEDFGLAELKKAVKAALDQKFPRDELLVLAYSLDGLGVRRPRRHKPLRHKDRGFKMRLKVQASFA